MNSRDDRAGDCFHRKLLLGFGLLRRATSPIPGVVRFLIARHPWRKQETSEGACNS